MATLAQGLSAPRPTGGVSPNPPPAAGGHGAPHAPAKPQGTAGHWVQQGGQWQLIHAVGPGHWVQGPKAGFKAPPRPKVNAALQPNANPLQPLTPQQITAQATNTVRASYKPVLGELNAEGGQEQAIIDKQSADNQVYQQWLNSKSLSVQAMEDQVNQSTNQLEQQLVGATNAQTTAEAGNLTAAANATPGNVGNNAPAFAAGSPLGNALGASVSASQQIAAGGAERALADERVTTAAEGASQLNAQSFLNAGAIKEQAAGQQAMQKIATLRAANVAKESGDIQREIARLEGVNINVAENNRNYNAAAEKLGISLANTTSEIQTRAAQTKIAAANANTNAARLQNTIAQDQINNQFKGAQLSLDEKKYILSVANSNSQAALRQAQIYKDKHGGGLTQGQQNTLYGTIDKATGEISSLIQANGLTPQEAYQAVLRGYWVTKNAKGNPVRVNVPRLSNQSLLNAAYNLRQGGPGLNPGDIGYLGRLGLTNVQQRYSQPGQVNTVTSTYNPASYGGGAGTH